VTAKKNKELLRVIGRRLREAELSTAQPACRDIERHLELLKHIETSAHRDESYAPDSAEPEVRELIPAGQRSTD